MSIDNNNGNTLWSDTITKEMRYVRVAFDIIRKGDTPPPRYQFIKCHMIFDVKMDDLQLVTSMVYGSHMTDVLPLITYGSVVYCDITRTEMTILALNETSVKTADIKNTYIKAPCGEKVYTILGPGFGPDEGKMAIII